MTTSHTLENKMFLTENKIKRNSYAIIFFLIFLIYLTTPPTRCDGDDDELSNDSDS